MVKKTKSMVWFHDCVTVRYNVRDTENDYMLTNVLWIIKKKNVLWISTKDRSMSTKWGIL